MRTKHLILITVTLIGVLVCLLIGTHIIASHTADNLERLAVARNVDRAKAILDAELQQLETTAGDYAGWNDAYAFVQNGNHAFINANLRFPTYEKLRLNLIVYLNRSGNIIFGRSYDYQRNQEIPVSPLLRSHLKPGKPLLNHPSPKSSCSGYLQLPEGLMFVTSRPVLTSSYQGPIMGTLVIGRYLDAAEIARLSNLIKLTLQVKNPAEIAASNTAPTVYRHLSSQNAVYVAPLNEERIVGMAQLRDIYGNVVGLLSVEDTRQIYQTYKKSESRYINLYGATTAIFFAIYAVIGWRLVRIHRDDLQLTRQLCKSKNILSQFLYHSPIYTYIKEVTPTEIRILQASDNFQQMIGIPGAAIVGKTMPELFPAEFAAKMIADDRSVIAEGKVQTYEEHFNGRTYTTIKFPIVLADSTLLAGYTIDITESKQAEDHIKKLNAELESRVKVRTAELEHLNQDLEGFCYAISHEFRAPVARLEGFGRMLLELVKEDGGEAAHCAQRIVAAGNRLKHVIDALLMLIRVTQADMHLYPVNLSAMAQQIATELLEQNSPRSINLSIAPDIVVQGDRHLLEIVMQNLLGNAVKYTAKTADAVVEFGKINKDGTVIYFVKDNGVGFDMADATNLFVPFCRLHTEAEFAGTGVGLATVARIIDKHRGNIWVEAKPNHGATFYFTVGMPGGNT